MTKLTKMYGVWLPGLGWVKAVKKGGGIDVYATLDIEVARRVAQRLGSGARLEYIDDALAMLETELLRAEARPKWYTLLFRARRT
jgi:hypothetical protein